MDFNTWHETTRREWQEVYAAKGWRIGQTYFNRLYDYRPWLADRILYTRADPFNNDHRMSEFLDVVCGLWDVEE